MVTLPVLEARASESRLTEVKFPGPTPQLSLRASRCTCTNTYARRAVHTEQQTPSLFSAAQSTDFLGASSSFGGWRQNAEAARGEEKAQPGEEEWKKEPCAPYVPPRSDMSSQDSLLHGITTHCFGTGMQHEGRQARYGTTTEVIFYFIAFQECFTSSSVPIPS